MPDLHGRVVLVTGASGGIGKETARALARMGAAVVMGVRDEARGEAAREDVLRDAPGARVEVMRLDVADLDDVRRFVQAFKAAHDRLDVLVNNAGVHTARREVTPQGVERTFATNHLGHFVLTLGLVDLLVKSAPSRVVNVASEAHRGGRMRFDDLMGERRWSGVRAYMQSKLANVLFTRELARRLAGTGVTANAVHPGSVRSNWARGEESGVFRFAVALATPFLATPEKGARTPVWAATGPELEGVTGHYLVHERPRTPAAQARDDEAARRLWEASEALSGARWTLSA